MPTEEEAATNQSAEVLLKTAGACGAHQRRKA